MEIESTAYAAYQRLAAALDALPQRFPPGQNDTHLRLLAKIFTPDEASLAAEMRSDLETPAEIAARLGRDLREVTGLLKEMSRTGKIIIGKTAEGRLGFGLMPFVVGVYEGQGSRIDAELAQLFEAYFLSSFGRSLALQPQLHRVIPVRESIPNTMEVQPYESASALVDRMQSWGVNDCICRVQKSLIGQPCSHPVDVCLVFSEKPDAFSSGGHIRPLDREGAFDTLRRAAEAGLVHCVSNNQQDLWYICNCCTCSCGILRGMAEFGVANVVAHSAFVNQVNEDLCAGCGDCVEMCQFTALALNGSVHVNEVRCVGCGVCVPVCPQGALELVRRSEDVIPPRTEADWRSARLAGMA
jgi:Na+-translocating ferredoxin:NAD+ oxidoreductase subunit B